VAHVGIRKSSRSISRAALLALAALGSTLTLAFVQGAGAAGSPGVTFTSTNTFPVPPASSFNGSGGGDGWAVALTPKAVYNVFHHSSETDLACHYQADGKPCWGTDHEAIRVYQQPTSNLIDEALPPPVDFSAAGQPGLYLDQSTGKLYMFTTRTSDSTAGVLCMDTKAVDPALNAQFDPTSETFNPDGRVAFCGFTPLSAPGEATTNGYNDLGAPAQIGSRWYVFNYFNGASSTGTENKVLCFDLKTFAACANQPYPLANIGTGTVSSSTPGPSVAAIGSKLIVPVRVGGTDELACFDTTAADPTNTDQTSCGGGWPTSIAEAASGFGFGESGPPYPMLSAAGTPKGVCLSIGSDPCWDLSGARVGTPPNMTSAITSTQVWNGPAVVIGPRVYVPNRNAGIQCYDYSAQADCVAKDSTGTTVFTFPMLPGKSPTTEWYTVNVDPQRPNCLWVNSDHREIANFDAFTGGACGQGPIRVVTASIVGSSPQCFPSQFTSLTIDSPARNTYTDGSVIFADASGNPLPNATALPLDANGTASLSSLQLSTGEALPQFLITLKQGSEEIRPDSVTVTVTWQGTFDPTCAGQGGTTIVPPAAPPSTPPTSPTPPPPTPQANVALAIAGPADGRVGKGTTFTATIKNTGQNPAQGVELKSPVPAGTTLTSASASQGTCLSGSAHCVLGTLAPGASATVAIVVNPAAAGVLTVSGHVSGDYDTNPADDDASASTTVVEQGAPPPAPPAPTTPGTVNAISTGTVFVNGVLVAPDTVFLIKAGDVVQLNGFLTFTTIGGAVGTFSNVPFTGSRRLTSYSALLRAAVDGPASYFTIGAPTDASGQTVLTLTNGDFTTCSSSRKLSAKPSSKVVRQLWGHAKGSFRTTAKYSSATIRGTTWGVQDRCDGTLTTALDDPVDVFDVALNKTVTITGGQTYLAKPPTAPFTPPAVVLPKAPAGQTVASVRKHGLRFAGRTFRTRAGLTRFLKQGHSSWAAFARANPAAAAALTKASRGRR
jgi:uncharacterized repeat protein (TIGR01451 family)